MLYQIFIFLQSTILPLRKKLWLHKLTHIPWKARLTTITAVPQVTSTDVSHLSKVCPFHTHPLLILLTVSCQEEPLKSTHALFSSEHRPCTGTCLQCHECQAGQICVLHLSPISCGIIWVMALNSGAGFNLRNLVLFGNQCFGGLPKLHRRKD